MPIDDPRRDVHKYAGRPTYALSMNSFPDRLYPSAADYLDAYGEHVTAAMASVGRDGLDRAAAILSACLDRDATIFACGNGGSAALANHLCCDHQKGLHNGTHHQPKVISLCANSALLTAVSNDIGYGESFAHPLSIHGRRGDVLVTISSSGNSENIVRALAVAESLGMMRITFTGFDGGRSRQMSDANIHVASRNYGVVEDVHQTCMHILAQYLRHKAMAPESLGKSVF
jgi:D-sedoheptulose 7-phosphate isomerase